MLFFLSLACYIRASFETEWIVCCLIAMFVLFVNCNITISVIFFCPGQILYPALLVKYAFPLSTTRFTDSGFPQKSQKKVPWFFHDFSRPKSKFPDKKTQYLFLRSMYQIVDRQSQTHIHTYDLIKANLVHGPEQISVPSGWAKLIGNVFRVHICPVHYLSHDRPLNSAAFTWLSPMLIILSSKNNILVFFQWISNYVQFKAL